MWYDLPWSPINHPEEHISLEQEQFVGPTKAFHAKAAATTRWPQALASIRLNMPVPGAGNDSHRRQASPPTGSSGWS